MSEEAKDFIKKILVADPNVRLNCQQMCEHPWMSKKLDEGVMLQNKHKLSKYVSVRKDKSKKNVAEDVDL